MDLAKKLMGILCRHSRLKEANEKVGNIFLWIKSFVFWKTCFYIDKPSTPGPWLVRIFRSIKNQHEPNPQHLGQY